MSERHAATPEHPPVEGVVVAAALVAWVVVVVGGLVVVVLVAAAVVGWTAVVPGVTVPEPMLFLILSKLEPG